MYKIKKILLKIYKIIKYKLLKNNFSKIKISKLF